MEWRNSRWTIFLVHVLVILAWNLNTFLFFALTAIISQCALYYICKDELKKISYLTVFSLLLAYGCLIQPDDDIYRYITEGLAWQQGINPYIIPPSQYTSIPYLPLVNHSDWTAIYGPFFIRGFSWIWTIIPQVWMIPLLWGVCHLLNINLIYRITKKHDLAKMYALSPFVLLETVGLGHFEQILVFSALLLIWASQHQKWIGLSFGICLSLWIKWWGWIVLPLFLRRKWIAALLLSTVISIWIVAPFLDEPVSLAKSLWAFKGLWNHGYVHSLIHTLFGSSSIFLLGLFCLSLLMVVLLVGGSLREQLWQFFRLMLWVSPTIHPWYFIFPLSCALCSGKKATFTLIGAAALCLHDSEFYMRENGNWTCSMFAGLPIFFLLLMSEWRLRHHFFREKGEVIESISIVTPVLNEADNCMELGLLLKKFHSHIFEWIVVDAGSQDQSCEIAKNHGAQVIHSPVKGRGAQIRKGIETAKNSWILVLHADTRVDENFFLQLKKTIQKIPDLDGGAFRMAYRGQSGLGPLMFLNDLKMRWLGISFGDQSQFLNKNKLAQRGGFPDLALMEDLELSLMWKGGNVAYITSAISSTSPRRWKSDGRLKNALLIIKLLLIYLWNRHWNPPVDVLHLYHKYYKTSH